MRYLVPILLACAVISGCSQTTKGNACDGWRKLNMQLETALFVTINDRQFANGVAGHNAHGVRQGCWK